MRVCVYTQGISKRRKSSFNHTASTGTVVIFSTFRTFTSPHAILDLYEPVTSPTLAYVLTRATVAH